MVEGVQSCFAMAQGGRNGNTFTIPVFLLPISFSLSLSLCHAFSFPFCPGTGKEVVSYLVFMPKLSTHHMHDPGSIVPHI
jgi:hypothetical protein